MLKESEKAPDFSLTGHDGKIYTLSRLKGKYVVIYFYPKDNTPGCTKEACDFRDNMKHLTDKGCVVFGISKDSITSHTKFQIKYDLNFILLSDLDNKVHQLYQVLEEGKTKRSTFLIDKQGKIMKIWPKVKVEGHVAQILNALS